MVMIKMLSHPHDSTLFDILDPDTNLDDALRGCTVDKQIPHPVPR